MSGRDHVDHEVFCDWRINVYDCLETTYFFNLHVASLVLAFVCTLTTILILTYRIAIRKDGLRTLTYGANFTTIIVSLEIICNMFYHLFVLILPNHPVSWVFWAAAVSLVNAPSSVYLTSIVDALPDHLFQSTAAVRLKSHLPSGRARSIIIVLFQAIILAVCLILFPLSDYYHTLGLAGTGEEQRIAFEISEKLFKAAATFMAASLLFYNIVFLYFAVGFIRIMGEYLKISPDELLSMTRKKVINIVTVMSIISLTFVLVLLLMAYFERFFMNLPLSMGFGFLHTLVVEVCATLGLISVIRVDIEKYKAESRKNSSSHSSPAVNLSDRSPNASEKPTEKVVIGETVVTF